MKSTKETYLQLWKQLSAMEACTDEHRRTVTALKSCVVPGCTNPRYHWRYARCWEHRAYLQVNPNPRVYKRKEQR